MQAAIRYEYGTSEKLQLEDCPIPTVGDHDILVRVHAVTVNRTDCAILTGKPPIMRLFNGLFKPSIKITGTDFAGEIVAIGKSVSRFRIGQRVWGFNGFGLRSHAEYICIPEIAAVLPIPESIGFIEAAASAEGAFYALDAVEMMAPKSGQKALVYGASGAIGSAQVQFLRHFDADVTAVCAGAHKDLILSLGASRVIDYQYENISSQNEKYDLVFDAVGKLSYIQSKPLLKPKGSYTSSEPNPGNVLATAFSKGKRARFRPPVKLKQHLEYISRLLVSGEFKPVMDRTYALENIREAFDYVASGQKIGNVVIVIIAHSSIH